TLAPTPLEMLVGSISAQQVNLSFAFACRARLVRRWGTPVAMPGGDVYAFPTPARLAAARLREYRALKFSTRKGEYIRDVARAVPQNIAIHYLLAGMRLHAAARGDEA